MFRSAIAIQVGSRSAPKVQVYMKPTSSSFRVFIDATTITTPTQDYSGIHISTPGKLAIDAIIFSSLHSGIHISTPGKFSIDAILISTPKQTNNLPRQSTG